MRPKFLHPWLVAWTGLTVLQTHLYTFLTVLAGAEWLAWGLKAVAEKTSEYMKKGGNKLQESLEPQKKPTEVDPMAKKSLYYARQAAGVTCKVSGFIGK